MRILIAEDDYISSKLLQTVLAEYGECDIAEDGEKALELFKAALSDSNPYDLVCLDIMMPNMSGRDMLRNLRSYEESHGIDGMDKVKVIMTTALDDTKSIMGAFKDQCDAYMVKPVTHDKLLSQLEELELV